MTRRTEKDWQRLISKYNESGSTTQAGFCKANGINLHTFRDRLCRLRKTGTALPEQEKLTTQKTKWVSVSTTVPSQNEIKIITGNIEIKISGGADEATLIQLCKTLLQLC